MGMNGLSLKVRLIGVAVISVLVLAIGFWGRSAYLKHRAAVNSVHADANRDSGLQNAAQGKVHDEQESEAKKEVARLKAQLAKLQKAQRNALPVAVPPSAVVEGPGVAGAPAVDVPGTTPDVEKGILRELVKAQDVEIKALTLSRDSWRQSSKDFQAQAVQEHAARVAAEGLAKSERWKGRLEGGGTVATAAYLLARLL